MLLSDIWSRSQFLRRSNRAHFESRVLSVGRTIDRVLRTHPFTDWISHFCCKCSFHSLDIIWPCLSDSDHICGSKWHFSQMSQEFPSRVSALDHYRRITMKWKNFVNFVGPELGFRKLSDKACNYLSVGFTLPVLYTFMLKRFAFSVSEKKKKRKRHWTSY